MTLDDLECHNRGFYGFFGDFGLWDTFQERIAPKSIVIDMEKLHMKFSAFNVNFDSPSLNILGLRMRTSKSSTLIKVVILPLLASLSWKRLQIGMDMLPITTSTSDELFSRITIDDFEWLWTSKIKGSFVDFCDFWLQRTLQEWTVTKWLEIVWHFANRNCYRLSRISWALAQISCYGLGVTSHL